MNPRISLGGSRLRVRISNAYGNHPLTIGAALDYGWTNFNGNSELGVIGYYNHSFPVIGAGYILNEPDSYLAPVSVQASNLYAGLYALDTFSATDRPMLRWMPINGMKRNPPRKAPRMEPSVLLA